MMVSTGMVRKFEVEGVSWEKKTILKATTS